MLHCDLRNQLFGFEQVWRRDTRRVYGRRARRTTGRVVTAVGFSGEGFKCAMVVGELACKEAIRSGAAAANDDTSIAPELVPSIGGENAVDAEALMEEMRVRFDPRRFL